MSKEYIRDSQGRVETNSRGERQFYSTDDGDSQPETTQSTYSESRSIFGGSTKNEATYNPSTGEWNDD